MHTTSVEPRPTMKVNIHNQCTDFKLKNPTCFSSDSVLNNYSAREVDAGEMMSNDFRPLLVAFEGALIYELQRKHVTPGNRPDSTHILLLVAWKYESYKEFCVLVHLIECNKWPYWDEIKPEEYYQRYANQLCAYTDPIRDTWLIHDGTVLMTELESDFTQRDGVLNIIFSEGIRDCHVKRPEWINLKR
jgi:hypothetical protein